MQPGERRGNERETKDKETNRHDGRCREMTGTQRTGHTWKMRRTYRENDRHMKGKSRAKPVVSRQFRVMKGKCPDIETTQGGGGGGA